MLAITSKLKGKIKKISPRALIISVSVFILTAIIINTVPVFALRAELVGRAEDEVNVIAREIAAGGTHSLTKGQRVLLLDDASTVMYDSEGQLAGRRLLIPAVQKAAQQGKSTDSKFEDGLLEAYTVQPRQGGFVYAWQSDATASGIVSRLAQILLLVTVLVGVLFLFVMNFGAWHIKKRIGVLAEGVSARVYNGPIKVSGADEITALAEELNRLSRQMLETEELRRNFVSDASHELRTPLSSIQLLVDSIIQNDNIDMETTREFMADMSEQIERLTRIAERLLLLTNLDGAKALTLEPVDMKKVAQSVMATLEQSALDAKVELKCNFAEGVTFMGTSDGTYQIIFNLVENAIKYNRPGGCVRVYIFKSDGKCNLIVDDNGIGIPEEDFELIFERFYRVDKARSRDKGGSGLGLAIVAKTVDNYNGNIKVEPSVDGGVRFTVTFPEEVEQ